MKNYFNDIDYDALRARAGELMDRDALRARANQMLDYADDAKGALGRWCDYAMEKAHGFSVLDFAVLKSCLLFFGLWLGTCFAKQFRKIRLVLFGLFLASWLYMMWRVFFDDED